MNAAFATFLSASVDDRRDAFVGAAQRLGTAAQNVEKDFWVCWTLDALFNGKPVSGPRLLFKGGTSLSKAYGLITRFSEDIDITIFRDDLDQAASVEELEALGSKKRRARLDSIKSASQAYVNGDMLDLVVKQLRTTMNDAGLDPASARVEPDHEDQDDQSLLIWYPAVTGDTDSYVRPAVKIESGAKSALDPHHATTIQPYVNVELTELDLTVSNITTVVAERTFWDKVVILHGLRQWFERRGVLKGGGQRISRHYYDLYSLLSSRIGSPAKADIELGKDCVRHARMFFNSPDLNLSAAQPGSFTLAPTPDMSASLQRDYNAMAGMIFGMAPEYQTIINRISEFESAINSSAAR